MKLSFLGALLLLLAGCATQPEKVVSEDPLARSLEDAAARIARAAEQAALAQSVGRGNSVTEEYRIDLAKVPAEMRTPILLEGGFNGELEVFLRSLADVVGWSEPVVLGMKPPAPIIVTFSEQRRPPVYWVADAGYQAGALADIIINSSLRQIIVRYKEAGGSQ